MPFIALIKFVFANVKDFFRTQSMHKSCDLKFLHVKCSLIDTLPFTQDYKKQMRELDMKLKTAQQVSNNFTSNTTQNTN